MVAHMAVAQGEQLPVFSEQVTESLLTPFVNYLTFGIDIAAGLIIGISAILALISFFKTLRKPIKEQTMDKETIRLRLARGMLLALDFEVGSDILKTILVPSYRINYISCYRRYKNSIELVTFKGNR